MQKKIAKEIEKISESIHKEHDALKTDRIEKDIALDILSRLSNRCDRLFTLRAIKRELRYNDAVSKRTKRKRKEE